MLLCGEKKKGIEKKNSMFSKRKNTNRLLNFPLKYFVYTQFCKQISFNPLECWRIFSRKSYIYIEKQNSWQQVCQYISRLVHRPNRNISFPLRQLPWRTEFESWGGGNAAAALPQSAQETNFTYVERADECALTTIYAWRMSNDF